VMVMVAIGTFEWISFGSSIKCPSTIFSLVF
jgi:hypothetical protein